MAVKMDVDNLQVNHFFSTPDFYYERWWTRKAFRATTERDI